MKNKKLYIIFTILIIIFSASLAEKTFQNDTFALIALGRDEVKNELDGYDHLTFHQGLKSAHASIIFEVALYKVYECFSFQGVYIFIILLSCINGLLIFNLLLIKNKSKLISFIITLLIIKFSSFIFTARPTIMVIPFMLFMVFSIEKILETNKNKYCIILIISSILLVNIHDVMWLIHFIFYLPFITEHILSFTKLNKWVNKKIIIQKYDNMKKLVLLMILDMFCMFSAHSLQSIFLLVKEIIYTVTGKLEITELSSVNIVSSLSIMIFIIFLILQFISKHKNRIADIFMLLGLIILSIIGIRYGVFLYFIGCLYINKIICLIVEEYNRKELINNIDNLISKYTNLLIIILIVIIISIKNFTIKIGDEYVAENQFPVDICEYIIQNLDIENIRVYNHFNYGAYLEFYNIPNFIDGRAGIYYQKVSNETIVDDFLKVEEGDYEYVFKKYNITHVILYNQENANEKIYKDLNYELLYQNDTFSLYENKQNYLN